MLRLINVLYFLLYSLFSYGQIIGKIDIKLENAKPDQELKVVIIMVEQADLGQLKDIRGKDAKATLAYNTLYTKAIQGQKEILSWLKENKIQHRSFYIVNMFSAVVSKAQLIEISYRSDVSTIIEDANFQMLQPIKSKSSSGERAPIWNLTKISAPTVWGMGITGQNVVIGGQDTGYAWDVTTIKSKYRGWNGTTADHNYNWHDAIHQDDVHNSTNGNPCGYNLTTPCDDHNHGTHTMGTMVGDVDDMGQEIGVAPGAKWIGCRNMERGWGTLSTYVECFEWFLAPYPVAGGAGDPTKMPHVINNSWGCPTDEGCNTSNFPVMEAALNSLRNAGCVIVVSAGNSGSTCGSVDNPAAIFEGSFSIGATNSADNIAGFSSRGPVIVDSSYRLKPNVSAPGVDIRSCLKNGTFANWAGTSMAGPHVAGLVALLISANPELAGEVDKIEDIIEQTAVNYTSGQDCPPVNGTSIPNNTFGYGRIDALAAVNIALPTNYIPYVNQPDNLVVSNAQNGVVMVSQNGSKFRLQVNNTGQLLISSIANPSIGSVEYKTASLNMVTSNSKIILKSPNSTLWQININNGGTLTAQLANIILKHSELLNGDVYISGSLKGILMRSPDDTCFLTNMSNLGVLLTIPAICQN